MINYTNNSTDNRLTISTKQLSFYFPDEFKEPQYNYIDKIYIMRARMYVSKRVSQNGNEKFLLIFYVNFV